MTGRVYPAAAPHALLPFTSHAHARCATEVPRSVARALVLAAGVLVLLPAGAGQARAGTEEFSTFSVEAQEIDDESLLDHMLTRMPGAWLGDWESAPMALRTAQGCLTSGEWINQTDLKLRTSLGGRAWFGLGLTQHESDRASYEYIDFSFHFPTRFGAPGAMFRPFHDKSRQDFAVMWDIGTDTGAFQLRAVFGLEDMFNNLWQFRQATVGGRSEPYLRHPWEPGLLMVVRRPSLRAEVGGRYLTPSTKRLDLSSDPNLDRLRTLWGTLAWASLDAKALGFEWEAKSTNHQAAGAEWRVDTPQPDGRDFRRQWSVEAAVRRRFASRLSAEARWLYQGRTQQHAPPIAPPRFEAVDRVLQVETVWAATSTLSLRVGGLHDRISVQPSGVPASSSYGSRREARAYIGLLARFGRVNLQGIEGIELDHEPYEVWAVHDKGFLQLQATF